MGVAADRPRGVKGAVWRAVVRVPFLRRIYIKRMLAFLEKSRRKKRPLPTDLHELDLMIRRLPESQRAEALEQAMQSGASGDDGTSRQLRRAATRQQRQSGKGGARRRPGGMAPPPGRGGPPSRGSRRPR